MKAIYLPQKITMFCKKAKISISTFTRDLEVHHNTIKAWTDLKNVELELRIPSPEKFLEHCKQYNDRGAIFDEIDFESSLDEYIEKLGLSQTIIDEKPALLSPHWKSLVGSYQLIRPHALKLEYFVLEALSIQEVDGGLFNTAYSHQESAQPFPYSGSVMTGERYYCSLLQRQGKTGPAFRCITFYVNEEGHGDCISGLMLRGMAGNECVEKNAVSLPFVAIQMDTGDMLKAPQMLPIKRQNRNADKLRLLDAEHQIVLGKIDQNWYPDLYAYCISIFNNANVQADGIHHHWAMYAVSSLTLKSLKSATKANWQDAVKMTFEKANPDKSHV